MSTNTTNYNLKKPSGNDFFDINDFNDNADIIDEEIKNVNIKVENLFTATQSALNTLDNNVSSINTSKANAADVYTKDEIDNKLGNTGTSVSELETKVNANATNIANNTANIGKISGKVGELTTLSTDDKTDLVKSINEVNSKANNNATSMAGLNSSKANAADVYTKTETDTKLSGKSDASHTHDGRYYTETEIDNKLSTKSDSTHNHDSVYYTKSNVYTKTETDTKLSGKSDASHTHDGRYYTKTEVDEKVQGVLSHKDENISSEQGLHGIRYYDGKLEVKDNGEWKATGANIPPRQVSNITALKKSTKVEISWQAPNTYDVDCVKYKVYIYEGNTAPSTFEQFTYITTVTSLNYTHNATYTNDVYVLVTSVSENDAENKDISHIVKAGTPPKQVTSITAYKTSSNVIISWTAPDDSACAKYNVYYYVGSTAPTSLSQFTKLTTTTSLNYSHKTSDINDAYIVVTSVTDNNIENDDISYVVQTQVAPSFANASWDTINAIAQSGQASSAFSIGDTKSISINGTNYNIQIYDFNHDDLADGSGKAKITFGLANCLSTTYKMNRSNTNSGGSGSCALRTTLQNTILNQLPTELKSLIKTVKKKTSAGSQSTTINTTNDTLFLFSEVELFGSTTYSVAGEGTQYPIFTDNNSRIKKQGDTGSAYYWWERSPYASNSANFCSVSTDGSANLFSASHSLGVCFGFCI